MNYTLQQLLTALANQTITIDSATAELTRISYYNQYSSYINSGQYIPIFYSNVINNTVYMNNTPTLEFVANDLFVADDWTVLNQNIYPFTATIISGNTTINNVSITLSAGEYITGAGIPFNTTVFSGSDGTYVLSNAPTLNVTLANLTMTKAYPTT